MASKIKQVCLLALCAIPVLACPEDAKATCSARESAVEKAYYVAHGGYWDAFVEWERKALNNNYYSWFLSGDRGYNTPYDLFAEYTKHWDGTHMIAYGIVHPPSYSLLEIPPWHDAQGDYLEISRARGSEDWHDSLEHYATDDRSVYGRWTGRGIFDDDSLETSCLVYDNGQKAIPTPTFRSSDYVHEGWHAWKQEHGIDNPSANGGHFTSQGNSNVGQCTRQNCDYFYPHKKSGFDPGSMFTSDVNDQSHYHSVYQAQYEYMCDIVDSSAGWVPTGVIAKAKRELDNVVALALINGSPIVCGASTPLLPSTPPGKLPVGDICGAASDCASGCCTVAGITRKGAYKRCAGSSNCIR